MSAAIDTGYEAAMQEAMDKWTQMTPKERKIYSQRLRLTTAELISSRASRLGLEGSDIAERTGYTTAWVSNVGRGKGGGSLAAMAEFATSIGYPLSFFLSLAEDMITIEDERTQKLGLVNGAEEE